MQCGTHTVVCVSTPRMYPEAGTSKHILKHKLKFHIKSIILLTNAFVTLWIMTAIGFNTDGLPSFKIGSEHLHAKGDIFAMKSLFGSSIRTKNGLIVKAFKNLSMVANSDRRHSSAFYISK